MLFTPDERRALLVLAALVLLGLAARWVAPGPPPPAGGGDSLLTVLAGARNGSPHPELPGPPDGLAADGRLSINRAGEEELTALPRVGPVLARRILEERARGGPFRDEEDLRRVRGIGPALARRLAPLLSFSDADSGAPADCTEVVRVARSPRGASQPFPRN